MIPRQSLSINAFTSASFPRKRESRAYSVRRVRTGLDSRFRGNDAREGAPTFPPALVRSADEMLISTDGMLTPTGKMLISTGEMLTPTGEMLTPTGEMLISTGEMLTSTDGMLTSTDGMLTSTDGILTSTNGLLGSTNGSLGSACCVRKCCETKELQRRNTVCLIMCQETKRTKSTG